MSDLHNLGFEPLQHKEIGDSVELKYDNNEIVSGKNLDYAIGGHVHSFGEIVALTGDFLDDYTLGIGEVDKVSDTWDAWPTRTVLRIVPKLVQRLRDDQAGIVERVSSLMKEQRDDFEKAIKGGQDATEAYREIAAKYSAEYVKATEGICDNIARSNWDHFGKDAIKAYCAFHTAALKKAKEAYEAGHPEVEQETLKNAVTTALQNSLDSYRTTLKDAKNKHIDMIDKAKKRTELNDAKKAHGSALKRAMNDLPAAFSNLKAIHQRILNPKITDNSKNVKAKLKDAYVIEACAQHYLTDLFLAGHIRTPRRELHRVHYSGEVHLMDRFAGLMHDEECTNGLEVTNRENQKWTMHDGKWLWGGVGDDDNMKIAKKAAQTSVDEIRNTSVSGKIPPRFKVQDKIPNLDFDSPENYTPLFRVAPGRSTILNLRGWDIPLTVLDDDKWAILDDFHKLKLQGCKPYFVTRAVPNKNFTWQLRLASTKLLVNRYDSDSRPSSGLWPSSTLLEYIFPENSEVIFAYTSPPSKDDDDHIFIVGRIGDTNEIYHVCIKYMTTFVSMPWNDVFFNENINPKSFKVAQGCFTGDLSIARCWNNAEKWTKVQICKFHKDRRPESVAKEILETPVDFLLSHSIMSPDTKEYRDYVCLYGHDLTSQCTTVTWLSLDQSGKQLVKYPWKEESTFPAQALLQMHHGDVPWLIRMFYGPSYLEGKLRINAIHLTIGSGGRNDPTLSSQEFDLVADKIGIKPDHVKWFTSDVKQIGVQDLIAFVQVEGGVDQSLQLVVFPGTANKPTFGNPVISEIKIERKGFKAPQMEFLDAHQVIWGGEKNSGIMLLFGNYGALEARYLLPISHSYSYELRQTLD